MPDPAPDPLAALAPETVAVHAGIGHLPGEGVAPPIHVAATFVAPGDQIGGHTYGRGSSPGWEPLEHGLARLEGGAHGVVFNAGMAAANALVDEARPGTAVVMPDDAYYTIRAHSAERLPPLGVELRLVDQTDLGAVEQALDGASLLWTETPTNPLIRVADLAALGALAAAKGVPWCCDSTFGTPVLQHPLRHGAAAVMHSATKYIGGHSDLLLGAVVCDDPDLAARLRTRRSRQGTQPDGFSCWLARRGMQTMPLRVRRQSATALALAQRLAAHPAVARVHYPGLPDDPGHAVASRQMDGAYGAMLSVVVRGGAAAATRLTERVRVWVPATSLGGVESLIERRARWAGEVADPALVRCSVGIEALEDLWADLEQALEGVGESGNWGVGKPEPPRHPEPPTRHS